MKTAGLIAAGVTAGLGITAIVLTLNAKPAQAAQDFYCPYCEQEFSTLDALRDHVAEVHPEERMPILIQWK